jgi:hypothetical protein
MAPPLWIYRHEGKEYAVTAEQTREMFYLLFDEVLIAGNEHNTIFLMDMMQAFREGKDLSETMGRIQDRYPALKGNENA